MSYCGEVLWNSHSTLTWLSACWRSIQFSDSTQASVRVSLSSAAAAAASAAAAATPLLARPEAVLALWPELMLPLWDVTLRLLPDWSRMPLHNSSCSQEKCAGYRDTRLS